MFYRIFPIFILISFFSCQAKKGTSDLPNYTTMPGPMLQFSQWSIPIVIQTNEINRSLTNIINQSFQNGFTIDGGYYIKTKLADTIRIQASGHTFYLDLPLDLEVLPNATFNQIKAAGQVEVQLKIDIHILENQLNSKTEINHHRWLNKPVVKIYGVSIPFGKIADQIIARYKFQLTQLVDQNIKNLIDLNAYKQQINAYLQQGIVSTDDNIIHVYAGIQEIGLSPIQMGQGQMTLPLVVLFEAVIAESKPTDLYNDLLFSLRPGTLDQSDILVQSRIPLPYLEQMLREQIENKEFGSGLSKILIKKIKLQEGGNTLLIELETQKAFTGKLQVSLEPRFDKETKKIMLDNFSLKVMEGKRIEKTLLQWFKFFVTSRLRNEIESQLNVFLSEYILYLNQLLNGYPIWQGASLQGEIMDYHISGFKVVQNRLFFNVDSKVKSVLNINQISTDHLQFSKP